VEEILSNWSDLCQWTHRIHKRGNKCISHLWISDFWETSLCFYFSGRDNESWKSSCFL